MNRHLLTTLVKREALRLGFDACGISKAEMLNDEARILEAWLNQNRHGKMSYMANHFEKRVDPRLLVDGAKSVISFSYNYYTEKKQKEEDPKLAMYALGKDYHDVVKEKLELLFNFIKEKAGEVNGRCFVDSAPVLERAWAQRSGIGWQGKNTNILTKRNGSYFFLAEIILDVELDYDSPVKDYCGTCTKCIDACPTDAILPNKEINGSQCISYFTIELKGAEIQSDKRWEDWIFGCDICQDVCPWNRFSKPHQIEEFKPKNEILNYSIADWEEITEDIFKTQFKDSPMKRSKLEGIKRNLKFFKKVDIT